MNNRLVSRVLKFFFFFSAIVVVGTLGYTWIEGWKTNDSLYMTIITMSTVGFGETHELTSSGRLFTLGLILMSIVCMSCLTAGITSLVVGGDLSGAFIRRKSKKMAAQLENHTIICGSGKMAEAILDRLARMRKTMVVIDHTSNRVEALRQRFPRVPIIEESPKNELVLAKANLLSARTVVAATDSDFDNLLIAMTCKDLHSAIQVFAVSLDVDVASRMAKIGVDEVISPYQIGGERIAKLIKNPEGRSRSPGDLQPI